MKRILICGITGSIGQLSLQCLEGYKLVGFSFNKNLKLANEIKNQFPNVQIYSPSINNINTVNDFHNLILKSKPDIILNAIVGFEGIKITKFAIENNIDIALANKESFVVAGELIQKSLKNSLTKIYPIDSEHTSLFELIHSSKKEIKKLYITASGGPFYNFDNPYSNNIDYSQAIKHPKWSMGDKISIDSATLINKAFELIEAHFLYPEFEIEAIYHPNCIIHSIVEFKDNSLWMNAFNPDMKLSIYLALHNFVANTNIINSIDFRNLTLTFDYINSEKWIPIKWANELIKFKKYIIGLIICCLDDFLIDKFKNKIIKFNEIIYYIQIFIDKYKNEKIKNWDDVFFWKDKIISECKILIGEINEKN